MSTVYLLSAGQRMCKNGGRIEIWKDTREKMYSLTLEDINSVVVGGHTQISTEVIYTLLQNSVQISYIDRSGKLLVPGWMPGWAFSRTEKLLHRLQDEYLTFLQARQLDSVWFKFDLYFHALTRWCCTMPVLPSAVPKIQIIV